MARPRWNARGRGSRGRLRLVVAGVVTLVLAATVISIVLATRGGGGWRFGTALSSYVVLYRENINGAAQWEVLAAQRPFTGSDLTYLGASQPTADQRPDSGTLSTLTDLYSATNNGVSVVSGRQPGPPSHDIWLADELSDATSRGVAKDLHKTQSIAGVRCAMFVVAQPPSGPLPALQGAPGHDDICVARNGLVLSESWTYHGKVVETRTAVSVHIGAGWPADLPQPPATTGAAAASAAGAVVKPVPSPSSFLASPPTPAGFSGAGAVSFRLPDPQHPSSGTVAASVIWAYVRGAQCITVEAGSEAGGQLPWTATDTVSLPAHLSNFSTATTALRSDGPEVRIDVGAGRWVRVRGTVPLAVLLKFAAELRLQQS
jgi:hypothetical protein